MPAVTGAEPELITSSIAAKNAAIPGRFAPFAREADESRAQESFAIGSEVLEHRRPRLEERVGPILRDSGTYELHCVHGICSFSVMLVTAPRPRGLQLSRRGYRWA